MPLFQQSVLKKYLNDVNKTELHTAWQLYGAHFLDPVKQANIRNLKEEEYQEGFVRDLFVSVLGFTLNPQPDYNFVLEKKTVTDATKSDGAILLKSDVIAVVELKDTGTPGLDKVSTQAFGYKHKHKNCVYVVTSNFEKLRFYINDATDFEEFNLFTLTHERFALLYLCLQQQNLLANIPLHIKQASLVQEENVTKKLYGDYSVFKRKLFTNIAEQNVQYDKLLLFKKTQKLLDRFLFILFAEDRLLLPPNSIREILKQWEQLKELDNYVPLYERFKKYFGYLNTGHTGKHHEIFPYNGGLFLPDETLDAITIDDTILFDGTKSLSNYDFETDIDVNILGHIFEHSLTEIEELQASLEGKRVEKSTTKRKKDGVFYTPRYITKYIVESTIGALCIQKKEKLTINEETFAPQKRKANRKALLDKLETYRNWLLQLTICDPACGSGAFLNAALEYLIAEHKTIDELTARIFGAPIAYSDIDNSILENNLYGVDINEDAIEIAKLSLWLRTAKKGRKLSNLSSNIKCGNSLIDDATVAGDKAFKWEEEFKNVFDPSLRGTKQSGFDVVIGNPPYLRVQGLRGNFEKETNYYERTFNSATGRFDIYILFIEQAFSLINSNGSVSFILPHKFMISDFGEGIRNFLVQHKAIKSIVSFGAEMVFQDASTYTCIITLTNNNDYLFFKEVKPQSLFDSNNYKKVSYNSVDKGKWNLQDEGGNKLFEKLNKQPLKAKDVFEYISQGVVSVGDDIYIMKGYFANNRFVGFSEALGKKIEIESDLMKPILKGDDVKKYSQLSPSNYIIYPHYELNGKTYPYDEEDFKTKFPLAFTYFSIFKDVLITKKIRYKTNPTYWYSLHRAREIKLFEQIKIITPETSFGTNMTLDKGYYYHNTQVYSLIKKTDRKEQYGFLLSLFNSKLMWYFLKNTGTVLRGGFFRFKTSYLENFPIPELQESLQQPFISKADIMLSKNKELNWLSEQFIQLLQAKFFAININNKLQSWYSLTANEFLKELEKQKIKFPLSHQQEWLQYFQEQKTKAINIKQTIEQTDKEIDAMVYELYGLTEEEIKIVEE